MCSDFRLVAAKRRNYRKKISDFILFCHYIKGIPGYRAEIWNGGLKGILYRRLRSKINHVDSVKRHLVVMNMKSERKVPFFNYQALFAECEQEYMKIVRDVLGRGAFIMQKDLHEFEATLAEYVGAKHAIGTADGTMALLMGLMAAGIGPGDEVIVPSHTFVASAAAIHHAGATPVLADCGPDHLIDADSVETLVTSRTRAIMPVQLNGRTADMDAILSIAERYDLVIVEDSCQALGSKFKGRFAGTFGICGAFSFFHPRLWDASGTAGHW